MKQKLTRHHKIPRSRGGKDDSINIKIVEARIHRAWHTLFQTSRGINMTPEEAIDEIKEWAFPDLSALAVALSLKKRYAWDLVFGKNTSPREAVEIIKKEWM